MPRSARVSSSAQSSTTTAMFWILLLNRLGRRRMAFSTSASNCARVIGDPRAARRPGPRAALEASDALDGGEGSGVANGSDDVLELPEVGDLDDEVVDPAAVVGHGDLGLRDVAVAGRDGAGDLREESRPVLADVDRDPDGPLARLFDVPLDVDQPLPVEHALGDREAVARVDGDAQAARDEADDRIARQRVAAAREPHQQVVDAADA